MKDLVEKLFDQSNRMQAVLEGMKSNPTSRRKRRVGAKIDSLETQFSVVNTGIDMVMERINKLSMQMAETKSQVVESLDNPRRPSGSLRLRRRSTIPPTATTSRAATTWRREGFQEYVNNYPQTELSDNALYWIGETFYGVRNFAEAVDAFDRGDTDLSQGRQGRGGDPEKGVQLPGARKPAGRGQGAPLGHPEAPYPPKKPRSPGIV